MHLRFAQRQPEGWQRPSSGSLRSLGFASIALLLALGACSSTYHPEYHPVTQYSQQITYPPPVVVSGSDPSERPVVVVTPAPAAPPAVPPPPPGFFTPE
jgi:hypothetical protein